MPSQHYRRFFIEHPLQAGQKLSLPEDLQHRLGHVLRLGKGAEIALLNGVDGLFLAVLTDAKARTAQVTRQLEDQHSLLRFRLAIALPKRETWETVLRQATEMGVTTISPITTVYSQVSKVNPTRARAIMVEAVEQCERLCLPQLDPLMSLDSFLYTLSAPCGWAYERGNGSFIPPSDCSAILVGPEGGFAPEEIARLQSHPHMRTFSLGPTILRVDTAVVAAITATAMAKSPM